jgi:hypothetical protein
MNLCPKFFSAEIKIPLNRPQHRRLNYACHGRAMLQQKLGEKMRKDYENFMSGKFVPTRRQLAAMSDAGYKFPARVTVAPNKKPRDQFGREIPDDPGDPERQYDVIDNPVFDRKNSVPVPIPFPIPVPEAHS